MSHDKQRFIVTCAARTGSSMLVLFLQSHPDICAHGEVLAPKGPLNFYGLNYKIGDVPLEAVLMAIRDEDPVAFLHRFVWQPGTRSASGFKGKYEELLMPRYASVLSALVADPAIKVIHLVRENLLARYLSQHLAVNVHRFFQLRDGQPKPPASPVRLDPVECEEDFSRTQRRQERFRQLFRGHDVIEITYEQLTQDRDATLAGVQRHIGVPVRTDLHTPTKRINDQPLNTAIENYVELARHFADSPYRRFFG